MLLWTWEYKYLLETLLSDFLGICPEVELLDHMVILFLILIFRIKNSILILNCCTAFHSGCSISHSHQQCTRVSISPHPFQHLLFMGLFVCFYSSRLNGWKVVTQGSFYLHFPNDIDVEHVFVYLLIICISFETCLFKFFVQFLIEIFKYPNFLLFFLLLS